MTVYQGFAYRLFNICIKCNRNVRKNNPSKEQTSARLGNADWEAETGESEVQGFP